MQEAGKALTVEQLCQMDGKPVLLKSPWWTEWCILAERGEHEIAGDAISFTRRHYGVVCLGLSDYGKTWTAYAYSPAHIDREKWEPCEFCGYAEHPDKKLFQKDGYLFYAGYTKQYAVDSFHEEETEDVKFCPRCGRPLTDEAWAELAKRIGVTV